MVNPELFNPVILSANTIAAASNGGIVSAGVEPTGIVQACTFLACADSLSADIVALLEAANAFTTPPVTTPFSNSTR